MDFHQNIAINSESPVYGKKSTLSEVMYDLNWLAYFPVNLIGTDVQVVRSNYENSCAFLKNNYLTIYPNTPNNDPFFQETESSAKSRYYAQAGDFFEFKIANEVVGFFVGTPQDWSTYYIRHISILPQYQNKKISQKFYSLLLSILQKHSVNRVEVDISPANPRHLHIFTKLGFHVVGVKASERWGNLVQLVCFLNPKPAKVFLNKFCYEGSSDNEET